jgi:F-type H+-transporting ATPase subunit b
MTLALLAQHGPEAQEGAAGGLGGPFALEPGLIIWTWLVFIVLFFLLRKYAWPPIVRLTEEREKLIAKQLKEAGQANADAMAALEEHKQLLAGAKDEAHKLINEAKGLASKEREHMLAQAREEQQQVLERAKREIAVERERAVAELRRTAVDLSLAAASKLIEQRLDSDADRKLVEEYLDTLEAGGR